MPKGEKSQVKKAREMTLNIQHGNGAVVVVRGPWIDKDSRKIGSE